MKPETKFRSAVSSKTVGWIVFVACLLLLSFGATPYHRVADTFLIATRFSLVIVLSVLVVRERWNHRHDLPGDRTRTTDRGDGVLQRMRRWYYGEESGNSY